MKLGVIILNWNHAQETIHCVNRVLGWNQLRPEIWIVDNGSRQDDLKYLEKENSRLHLVKSKINKGFAGGNNLALREISRTHDCAILLLNYDAKISENDISKLITALQNDSLLGIVGPILYDSNHPDVISTGGRDISRNICTRIMRPKNEISSLLHQNSILKVDYVPGSVALIRGEALSKTGLLDENYFFSGEIADFCERLKQNGYTCAIESRSEAEHAPGKSKLRNTLYRYYNLRNRFLFIRKFRQNYKFAYFTFWIFAGMGEILINLIQLKLDAVRAGFLAIRDGLTGKFGDKNAYFIG